MNDTKFIITYKDGTTETIYGDSSSIDDGVFQIELEAKDGYDYIYIPLKEIRKVEERE